MYYSDSYEWYAIDGPFFVICQSIKRWLSIDVFSFFCVYFILFLFMHFQTRFSKKSNISRATFQNIHLIINVAVSSYCCRYFFLVSAIHRNRRIIKMIQLKTFVFNSETRNNKTKNQTFQFQARFWMFSENILMKKKKIINWYISKYKEKYDDDVLSGDHFTQIVELLLLLLLSLFLLCVFSESISLLNWQN